MRTVAALLIACIGCASTPSQNGTSQGGQGSATGVAALNGKWALTDQKCNGVAVSIVGMTSTAEINNGKITDTSKTSDCTAVLRDYDVKFTNGKYSFVAATGTVECTPSPSCELRYTARSGAASVPATIRCPEDIKGSGGAKNVTVADGTLTVVVESGNSTCEMTYTKL